MADRGILEATRKLWWTLPLAVAVAVATSMFLTSRQTPTFQATATAAVAAVSADPSSVLDVLDTLERRTILATLARVPAAPDIRSEVAGSLGLGEGAVRGYRVRSAVVPNTNAISISVTGPSGETAASLANAVMAASDRAVRDLYPIFTLRALTRATVPMRPEFPNATRNHLAAVLVGLLVALASITLVELAVRHRA